MSGCDSEKQAAEDPKDKGNQSHSPDVVRRRFGEALVLALYFIFEIPNAWHESHERAILQGVIGTCAVLLIEFPIRIWVFLSLPIAALGGLLYFVLGPTPPPAPIVGWLQPANDPTPANGCGTAIEPGSVVLIVGGSGFVLSPHFSHVNAVTLGACSTLTMTLGENGLSLSSELYDPAGLPIGTLIDNRYTVNTDAHLITQASSDLSTLVIHSDEGVELLYVRYTNPYSIIIRGILSCPRPRLISVKITNTEIRYGNGNSDGGDCSHGSLNGFVLH